MSLLEYIATSISNCNRKKINSFCRRFSRGNQMQHPPPSLKHNQPCQVKRLVTNEIELHSSISIRFRDGRLEPNDYLMPQKTLEFPIFFPKHTARNDRKL